MAQLETLAMGASKFVLRPIEPVAHLAGVEAYLKPPDSALSCRKIEEADQ
jgi:hypothetical protein